MYLCQIFVWFLFFLYDSFFFLHRLTAGRFGNLNVNREHMFGGLSGYIFIFYAFVAIVSFFLFELKFTRDKVCLCDENSTWFYLFCFLTSKEASQESCLEYS